MVAEYGAAQNLVKLASNQFRLSQTKGGNLQITHTVQKYSTHCHFCSRTSYSTSPQSLHYLTNSLSSAGKKVGHILINRDA